MEAGCAVAAGPADHRSIHASVVGDGGPAWKEEEEDLDFVVNKVDYPSSVFRLVQDHRGLVLASAPMETTRIPKSVLKKKSCLGGGDNSTKRAKRRVTFDEAVSFYCDDYPDIRFLALQSDVGSDLYFMFEPPPEYQDWNPDPPAEYRDHRSFWVDNNIPAPPTFPSWTEIPPPHHPGTIEDVSETPSGARSEVPPSVILSDSEHEEEGKVSEGEEGSSASPLQQNLVEERYLPDLIEECSTSFNDYNEIEEGLLDELRKGEINEDVSLEIELGTNSNDNNDVSSSTPYDQNQLPNSASESSQVIIKETKDLTIYSIDELKRTILEDESSTIQQRTNTESLDEENTNVDSQPLPTEGKILQKQESELSDIDLELEKIAKEEEERANSERIMQDDKEEADESEEVNISTEGCADISEASSQIRKYFEENALTCSILRGIEARRRDEKRSSRPKSPLPSRDSLVEQLRRLTTMDDDDGNITGDDDDTSDMPSSMPPPHIFPEPLPPPQVNLPHNNYQELHVTQVTHIHQQTYGPYMPPPPHLPSNTVTFHAPPAIYPTPPGSVIPPPPPPSGPLPPIPQYIEEERVTTHIKDDTVTTTVNKTFKTNRFRAHFEQTLRRHLADGGNDEAATTTRLQVKMEDSSDATCDELERFVQRDIERIQRIKKRYSMSEEEGEDPTFGFARRPSVRGIRTRFGSTTEILKQIHTQMNTPTPNTAPTWHRLSGYEGSAIPSHRPTGPPPPHAKLNKTGSSGMIHTEGGNTYRPQYFPRDQRYYSQNDAIYGTMSNLLPASLWTSRERHSAFIPLPENDHSVQSPPIVSQALKLSKDERGTPEGASSSPQVSSDSLYSSPPPLDASSSEHSTCEPERSSKEGSGVIYYSMNV